MPPEVSRGGWDVIKNSPTHAVDSYDYGLLVAECFNGASIQADQAAQAPGVPSSMVPTYRRFFHANPKARLSVANFLEQGRRSGGFFQTALINLTEGVDRLGLMSDGERDEFFSELDDVSGDFPEEFMKHKILPELIKSVEFGGGGPKVFAVVLQIGAKLSNEEFDSQLTPVLIRLFARQDRAMRVCLLENMHLMIDHLTPKIVNDKVFPALVTGFTDQAPLLREQTVKSVLVIVSKLSDRTVNGELLKYLAKTANDPEPGIRTNTTICLGKIAKSLNATTRSKVLIAAFTRSLRDPFVHARNASLLALGATVDMFTDDDCATKVLPAICPSLIDKEKVIRDQANKTLENYLTRVRKHAQSLPDTAIPIANGAATTGPRMGTPTPAGGDSWTGWAISSFTNKITTASGEMSSKPPPVSLSRPKPRETLQPTSAPRSAPTSRPPSTGAVVAKPELARNATETTKLAASFTAPEITEDDWGQDDWGGGDDTFKVEEDDAWGAMAEESTAKTPTTPSVQGDISVESELASPIEPVRPAPKKKQSTSEEPDFASWLKAQQGTKTAKPLPKGLASNKSSSSSLAKPGSRPSSSKLSSGGNLGAKKIVQPPKQEEKKPETQDDDWGDSW